MFQDVFVLVTALATIIVLITLAKLSRQLDEISERTLDLQKTLKSHSEILKYHRETVDGKLERVLQRLGNKPGQDIPWTG